MIKKKEILDKLENNEELIYEFELPVIILTKLIMYLKFSGSSKFEANKPIDNNEPYKGVKGSNRVLIEEILKDEVYIKNMMEIYETFEIAPLCDMIGFVLAIHLKDKNAEEINTFLGIQNDLKEEDVKEIKSIMKLLDINF